MLGTLLTKIFPPSVARETQYVRRDVALFTAWNQETNMCVAGCIIQSSLGLIPSALHLEWDAQRYRAKKVARDDINRRMNFFFFFRIVFCQTVPCLPATVFAYANVTNDFYDLRRYEFEKTSRDKIRKIIMHCLNKYCDDRSKKEPTEETILEAI